jgi:hypothetical protein
MSAYHRLDSGGNYCTAKITSVPSLNSDTWYHLGVSYDGISLNLYLNGIYQSGNTASTWDSGNTVGIANTGAFESSTVSMDDIRFYRKSLSANVFYALYHKGIQ